MDTIENVAVFSIALLHLGFLYLEMVVWPTPKGQKIFKIDAEFAARSAALAKNQGLYNGFLAAGLIWSVFAAEPFSIQLQFFFLGCVIVAGIFGAITASRNILFLQALPAAVALAIILFKK